MPLVMNIQPSPITNKKGRACVDDKGKKKKKTIMLLIFHCPNLSVTG